MVGENTAYTGVKLEDGDRPGISEKIATVKEDGQLLSRLLQDAGAVVGERLKDFVTSQLYDGERLLLMLEVSESYDEISLPVLRGAVLSAIGNFVTSRWLRLVFPERAGEWEAEGQRQLGLAERNLYHRRKPARRLKNKEMTINNQ